jgi:hypothetical protein
MYQTLAQEPWCFHPEQIASLTDWQIENLYAKPALERSKKWQEEREQIPSGERLRSEANGDGVHVGTFPDGTKRYRVPNSEPDQSGPPSDPNSPEMREWVIRQFMTMGMKRATAEKRYDEQKNQAGG